MRYLLGQALNHHGADYVEIRIEDTEANRILYRGRSLENIGTTTSTGGNVRALLNDGWGFVSFTTLDKLEDKVALAVRQAKLVGQGISSFAAAEPIVDIVEPSIGKDPGSLSIDRKQDLVGEYNDIMMGTGGIQTTNTSYSDVHKKVIFANSEGSYIEQDKVDITLRLSATAKEGSQVQQAGISLGGNGDFNIVEDLHDRAKEVAQRAVELIAAPTIKGGPYTVILDPVLAGVFVHEAFGHLSEADHVYENDDLKKLMVLGRKFGGPQLNIVDGALIPGLRGSYKYDEEGVAATKSDLIREGELVGRLHSRETAAKMNESPTGNARAIDFRFQPIVRMTNTFIEAGSTKFEDMLADVKQGVYACDWYGGMTSMEMFTFSAREAYMIRNGRIAELLRPVTLSGNVFDTLENIDAICDDLAMNQGGGCGKGGQSPLPVSNGSPHIRIARCLVGGK